MSNVSTYNQLINRFKTWAEAHEQVHAFAHGSIDRFDLDKMPSYPLMFVSPDVVTYANGIKTHSLQIIFADRTKENEDRSDNEKEVLSDIQQIAEDLIATFLSNASQYFGELVSIENPTLTPFIAEYSNTLTGWVLSIGLVLPYQNDFCIIPSSIN